MWKKERQVSLFKETWRWNNDVISGEKAHALTEEQEKLKSKSRFANLKVNWVECSWPIYSSRFNPEIYKQTQSIENIHICKGSHMNTWTHAQKTLI